MAVLKIVRRTRVLDGLDSQILESLAARIVQATPDEHLTLLTLLEHPKLLSAVERLIAAFPTDGLE